MTEAARSASPPSTLASTVHLDHVSYACAPHEVLDVVQRIGSDLGAPFTDGGLHPAFGTRNFVLPLAGGVYIEVVAALDHPAADKAPFGRAVRRRADEGGGWLGWVVSVPDIAVVEERLGRPSVVGHRIRPDGVELSWRQIGVLDLLDDPQCPFFVEWQTPVEHPSTGGSEIRLTGLHMCGDPTYLVDWLGAPPDQVLGVPVEWVESEDRGLVACLFDTPRGPVLID